MLKGTNTPYKGKRAKELKRALSVKNRGRLKIQNKAKLDKREIMHNYLKVLDEGKEQFLINNYFLGKRMWKAVPYGNVFKDEQKYSRMLARLKREESEDMNYGLEFRYKDFLVREKWKMMLKKKFPISANFEVECANYQKENCAFVPNKRRNNLVFSRSSNFRVNFRNKNTQV